MEIENSSASMPSSFHPQVTNRRPGSGKGPASASQTEAEPNYAVAPQTPASPASPDGRYPIASRRISDMDSDLEDVTDGSEIPQSHLKLLRDTQIALQERARPSSSLESDIDGSIAPKPSRGKPTPHEDGQYTFAMNDNEESSRARESMSKSGSRSNKSKTPTDGMPHEDGFVSLASAKKNGPDRAVQHAVSEVEDSESDHASISSIAKPHKEKVLTWEQHLQAAMKQLNDSQQESLETPQQKMRAAVISRLLALSLNDREAMLESIQGLQSDEQDYLNYQMTAIFDAIDPEAHPTAGRKWSLVMVNQRKANTHLASLSNLEIKNLSFCSEVVDFGVTTPFANTKFRPGEEVLLYLELDNFVSEKTKDGKGYETQLQGSYEIADTAGRRVTDQTLPADTHVCKNIRRDYFIAYRVYLPQNISAGSYKLNLTIEDLKGRKFGHATIDFQIQ